MINPVVSLERMAVFSGNMLRLSDVEAGGWPHRGPSAAVDLSPRGELTVSSAAARMPVPTRNGASLHMESRLAKCSENSQLN